MDENERKFEQLCKEIRSCRECQARFGYAPRPVQRGARDAKIVQISQAPGAKVHESGIPFWDQSGKRLREKWYQISEEEFYNEHNFYFAMAAHCYPGKAKSGDKLPPKVCWKKWGEQELALLEQPRLILVIGAQAASRLFPGEDFTKLVFEDLVYNGVRCFVLPHPSALNRRWFAAHPQFEKERVPAIRQAVWKALGKPEGKAEKGS